MKFLSTTWSSDHLAPVEQLPGILALEGPAFRHQVLLVQTLVPRPGALLVLGPGTQGSTHWTQCTLWKLVNEISWPKILRYV